MKLEEIRNAKSILVISGAGVSAESGIPTFRDPGGWWKNYRPEQLATLDAFRRNPVLVWEWYDMRRSMVAKAQPNRAHQAIARVEQSGCRIVVVTQNVDDLHERAGSTDVIHVHGQIWQLRCMRDMTIFEDRQSPLPTLPPRCSCGEIARPNVVWFNEMLDTKTVERVNSLVEEQFDYVIVVGTEAVFGYIQQWAVRAQARGAILVEVNPKPTALTPIVDLTAPGKAGDVLHNFLPH